jgi:hypothetical protein
VKLLKRKVGMSFFSDLYDDVRGDEYYKYLERSYMLTCVTALHIEHGSKFVLVKRALHNIRKLSRELYIWRIHEKI